MQEIRAGLRGRGAHIECAAGSETFRVAPHTPATTYWSVHSIESHETEQNAWQEWASKL